MRLFQSERRLSKELSKILTSQQEKLLNVEKRALKDEQDFLVYLESDLEVDETNFHHYQIRDGSEVVFRL
jgi:hypothetical protein